MQTEGANSNRGSGVLKMRNRRKILIVDDEKFNCDIIYGFLMILGVKNRSEIADFAYNGEEALSKVQQAVYNNNPYEYAMIMMDCNMPFMDGYEATHKIRKLFSSMDIETERQPHILGVTGHVESEYVKKAIDSGMNRVYSKPLHIIEFGKLLLELNYIDQIPPHLNGG